MIFEIDNYIYDIKRNKGETDKYINLKGLFICYQNPTNIEQLEYYSKFGSIYANIMCLNCEYSKEIINELNNLGENVPFFEKINQ